MYLEEILAGVIFLYAAIALIKQIPFIDAIDFSITPEISDVVGAMRYSGNKIIVNESMTVERYVCEYGYGESILLVINGEVIEEKMFFSSFSGKREEVRFKGPWERQVRKALKKAISNKKNNT